MSPPPAIALPIEDVAAAPSLPDLWPPVKVRRGFIGFLRRDYPVIQGIVLLFSFLYVLVNLMVDVVYTLVDPRIRY